MGWLIFLGILLLILGILMIPVQVAAEYKESFILDIKFLMFFKKRLIPFEKKKKEAEPEKEAKPKAEKAAQQKPKQKRTLVETMDMIIDIVNKYGPGAKMILRNIRFHNIELYWKISGEDAADCGIKYGRICAWFGGVSAFFRNLIRIEHQKLKIFPDFLAVKDEIYGGADLEFNPLIVLIGALRMGVVYIKDIFKKAKQNKKRRKALAKRQNIKAKEST